MKQIEAFVNSIYHNTKGNKKEIQELKSEMINHLREAVHELKSEGKSEKEAIEIAISRFGEEKEMQSIISQMFKAQQTFAKWVLYLAIGILIVSTLIFASLWKSEQSQSNDISIVATQISDILKNKDTTTPEMEKEIEKLVKSTNYISSIEIFDISSIPMNELFEYIEQENPVYSYKRSVWAPVWLKPSFYPYGNGHQPWYVGMEERSFGKQMSIIIFVGIAIYWTLFSIWAIINAYHHRRLNIGWIVGFVLFNVVGYLVYYLFGRKQSYN